MIVTRWNVDVSFFPIVAVSVRFRGLYSLEVRLYSPLGWDCFQIHF